MLQIIIAVLPTLETYGRKIDELQHLERHSSRFLINCFTTIVFKEMAQKIMVASKSLENQEEGEGQLQEKRLVAQIQQQVQKLAIRLSGITMEREATIEDASLLEACSFIEWRSSYSEIRFKYPLFHEFFVAQSIEEELNEKLQSENLTTKPTNFLLNEILLTSASYSAVINPFLRDSVQEKRIQVSQLIDFIKLSRQSDLSNNSFSRFTIAAANAITILNTTGYDFRHKDLSKISISGANLSYGLFEGASFINANLQGVYFHNAWLKGVNFSQANLKNADFGGLTHLKLRRNVQSIAFSPHGRYFAADIGHQTVIFEESNHQQFHIKELRRLPGRFPRQIDSPFSPDGNCIFTVDKNNLVLWDISSGKALKEFKFPPQNEGNSHIASFKDNIVFFGGDKIQKFHTKSGSWVVLPTKATKDVSNCEVSSRSNELLLVGDLKEGAVFYDLTSAKLVAKLGQRFVYYKLSADGRQLALEATHEEVIRISDCVRRHAIKSLENKSSKNASNEFRSLLFSVNGKLLFAVTANTLIVQDVAQAKVLKVIPLESSSSRHKYSLNPVSGQVAAVTNNNTISFFDIGISNSVDRSTSLQGVNREGVDLKDADIDATTGLSDENIKIFQGEGIYDEFDENTIKKIFLTPLQGARDIHEINLPNEKLTEISAIHIGKDSKWVNLQRLDLSINKIGDDGGVAIGGNKSWPNLEELILRGTGIADKAAARIASNQTWKNLKTLHLAANKIGDDGASAIGRNKTWEKLETLDLHHNEIAQKGVMVIAHCETWTCLKTLELSSNKIDDKNALLHLCKNSTWRSLKALMLQGNPVKLQNEDIHDLIEGIRSTKLEVFGVAQMKLDQKFLQYLKYTLPRNVIEISLANRRYDDPAVEIISCNTTWTSLKFLDLSKNRITDEATMKITANKAWANLEEIDLSNNQLGGMCFAELEKNKIWDKLRVLNLSGNKIGAVGANFIGKHATWPNLRVLDLGGNNIGPEGVVALSGNKTWKNLHTLILKSNAIDTTEIYHLNQNLAWVNLQTLDLSGNMIGDSGAEELSKNRIWSKLQTLVLENNLISAKGIGSISKSTTWIMLKALDLKSNPIKDEGADELGNSSNWKHLQVLELEKCSIGDRGAGELSKNTAWTELDTLNLRSNAIGPEGAAKLSKNTVWAKLQTLDLKYNSIGAEGARALGKDSTWAELKTLSIGYNSIRAEGIEELSKNSTWKKLESLDLESNLIGSDGAVKLSRNTSWSNLQVLNLRSNSIGTEGVRDLSQNLVWTKLHTLDLAWNMIDDKGAEELSRNVVWTNLMTLNLGHNLIGVEGIKLLNENKTWTNLSSLNLGHNKLGAEGAGALGKNITWRNLQILCLENNEIGTEGAARLSRNTSWSNLRALNLRSNFIDARGAEELSKNASWVNMQTLDLLGNDIH